MLLVAEISKVLYPLVLAAAGLIVVVLALGKLAMHLRRIAMDSQAGPTATGLSLQQIEQMYERGQISRQEFSLLRRKALADVIGPESPVAYPVPPAPGSPSRGQNRSQPSPTPPAETAGGGIADLDITEQARLRRQREDDTTIRTRRLLVAGLAILAAGLVWLGVFMHRPSGPSGQSATGPGMLPGPGSLPAQSTQPASRMATPWSFLPPASGPATPASPPTQPADPR